MPVTEWRKITHTRRETNHKITHIGTHGFVDGSPPDLLFGGLFLDDALVGGRTTSLCTRVGAQGTAGGDGGTGLIDKGIFIEGSDSRVGNLYSEMVSDENLSQSDHDRVPNGKDRGRAPYNCNSVIVNVCSLVELFFQLGVTLARPANEG